MGSNELRRSLIERLKELGVEDRPWPGRDDGFSSLYYADKEFAHFHNDDELDIRLTKAVIDRERLTHPPSSVRHPNRKKTSAWIELPITNREQLERVVRLIAISITV